jgi:DNA topoisomerase I
LSKNLVIVESPTKVKTISKFLTKDYEVTSCSGHIRDLPKTKMGVDIDKGFKPHYITISKKKKIVSDLKKKAKNKEEVYLACDPDREGEAIAWHITQILNSKIKFRRVVFNELTKDVVIDSFKHPASIDMYKVRAQQARRILDRIVGYNLSPLLWKKVGRGLSAGRVQSVTLSLIVKREREVLAFKPEEYWEIEAELKKKKPDREEKAPFQFTAKLDKIKDKEPKIKSEEEAGDLVDKLKEETFIVTEIKKKRQKRRPKPPFITSTLQQSAFNKLEMTASKTMRIAQQLYEGVNIKSEGNVGLITYMRTDSVAVSQIALKQTREFIEKNYGKGYVPDKITRYKSRKTAQEAHEAIRPTSAKRTPEELKEFLTKEQYKLYNLIWKRFIASCMKEAELLNTTVLIRAGDCLFKATGSMVLFDGFMIIYKDKIREDKKVQLPRLSKDEELDLLKLIPSQHFTKPPPRYTDATLVKTLEENGIGRPSTYAPTIWTIITRHYIRREKRYLMPTELGIVVSDLLVKSFPDILDEEFTAKMEEELDKVEQGTMKWQKVLEEFYRPFMKDLESAKTKMRNVKKEVIPTDENCQACGRPMVIKWSRRGKFLSCSGFPECRNAKSLTTGIKCPEAGCDGMLVRRQAKSGRSFYGCTNYPKCKYVGNKLPEDE